MPQLSKHPPPSTHTHTHTLLLLIFGFGITDVQVWNPTIANLSLMALGSSAPEIILSVIEVVAGNFFAGALGPSTIVGSAAFNLLVIIAVCIMAIPNVR